MSKIKRRAALRRSVLLALGMALGNLDALKAQGGQLTVDLNQWQEIVFKHRGKTLRVPVAEVFEALAAERGASPVDWLRNDPVWNGLS